MVVNHVFTETRPTIDAQQSGSFTDDDASIHGTCSARHFGSGLGAFDCVVRRALCISGARERNVLSIGPSLRIAFSSAHLVCNRTPLAVLGSFSRRWFVFPRARERCLADQSGGRCVYSRQRLKAVTELYSVAVVLRTAGYDPSLLFGT
jgi:hypothetical protein